MLRVNTWATRALSTLAHIVASISSPRMPFRRTNPDRKDNVRIFCRSNKQSVFVCLDELNAEIAKQMAKNGEVWQCLSCMWTTKYKTRLWEHVEAKHVTSHGYNCPYCSKFCSSKNAWHQHKSKFHKGCWNIIHFKCIDLETEISEKMEKLGDVWQCRDCLWTTKYKTRLWEHVEAIHVQSHGYNCPFCAKFCPSKKAWINHKSKFHKGC